MCVLLVSLLTTPELSILKLFSICFFFSLGLTKLLFLLALPPSPFLIHPPLFYLSGGRHRYQMGPWLISLWLAVFSHCPLLRPALHGSASWGSWVAFCVANLTTTPHPNLGVESGWYLVGAAQGDDQTSTAPHHLRAGIPMCYISRISNDSPSTTAHRYREPHHPLCMRRSVSLTVQFS